MSDNNLRRIQSLGTSVWIDALDRELLEEGRLRELIEADGVSGVTSNPTIFATALEHPGSARALPETLDATADPTDVYMRLAFADTQAACDLLYPTFARTEGADGYVSFELPPDLAYDSEASVAAAVECNDRIDRPNALIKVPGTREGVHAVEELTTAGVSVNITLLFAIERYEEVAEAYLRGLQRRVDRGEAIDGIASVASFFLSRVDTKVDQALEERNLPAVLRGKAGIANARLAYASFQRIFSGERWRALAARGAQVQRPLWASTSTKNRNYPDTLYVDALIGPNTINTMPPATLDAARDHATPVATLGGDVSGDQTLIRQIREAGIDLDELLLHVLPTEGVRAFADSFESAIAILRSQLESVDAPGAAR